MKNYSKITQNKDILTREYADSTYAKVNAENTFTAKQTINSGMGVVSLKTQGYMEIGASYTPKKDIGGLFGFKDDGTGRIYAIVPRDLGFVERIKMNNSSIEPGNTGTVDLGTVLTAHQNIKTLNTNNTTPQTVNASESISGLGTINLHKVAKTGNYNDLSNTPSIPAAVTESTVSGWGFTKNTGTITGIKMNGGSKGTSGVVDLGTVITDISGLMPKSGGTFTGAVTFNKQINLGQGDANCLYLGTDGRLNGPENRTLFGLVNGTTTFGHTAYALAFRGSGTRPNFNGNDLALRADIPTFSLSGTTLTITV